jgi:hypothetical protein
MTGGRHPKRRRKIAKIDVSYDKFKDRTTVETDFMGVYGSDWNSNPLEIAAVFTYSGRVPTRPEFVTIYFWSHTPRWRFADPPIILAIANKGRLNLGQSVRTDANIRVSSHRVSVDETIAVVVPMDTFRKLAFGAPVETQVGQVEFKLEGKPLLTFQALADYMVP